MTVLINDHHFSPKSSASRILATALREANVDSIARHTIKHFEIYVEGLTEIGKMDNPTRHEVFILWHLHHLAKAIERLKPRFEKHNLPFSEYENLLIHRLRQARLHGRILQKMRK